MHDHRVFVGMQWIDAQNSTMVSDQPAKSLSEGADDLKSGDMQQIVALSAAAMTPHHT
jgi:hypothetical protein